MTITSKTSLVVTIERNATVSGICKAGETIIVTYRSRRSATKALGYYSAFGLTVTQECGHTLFIAA